MVAFIRQVTDISRSLFANLYAALGEFLLVRRSDAHVLFIFRFLITRRTGLDKPSL